MYVFLFACVFSLQMNWTISFFHSKIGCPEAEGKYHEFLEGAGRWRYDVWRTLLERDQTRQMMEALTQRASVDFCVC